MAKLRQCGTECDSISTESRLAAALILLAGGRDIECMRAHWLSNTFVNQNFHRVVDVIISCPDLAIKATTDPVKLEMKARRFCE